MSTKATLALSVIAATAVLTIALAPALIQNASAVRVDEPTDVETGCNDPRFEGRESCPGNSENSEGQAGDEREDITTCTARNPGQAKNCPEDTDETIIVNPPN
jgi:hypothetical protein